MVIVALVACDPWKSVHDIQPVVESIQLSTTAVAINYRAVATVSATVFGKHNFPLEIASNTWSSDDPAIVTVMPTGDRATAELHPTGVGSTLVRVSAGDVTETISVSVPDTAYGVTLMPNSAALTVGDTITLTATVAGPVTVNPGVLWRQSPDVTILAIAPDSTWARIQVIGTTAGIIVRAVADTTKAAIPTFSVSPATLVFTTQPSTVAKLSPFASSPRVEVRNESGVPSARSASVVSVVVGNAGSCGDPGLFGPTRRSAANGAAAFTGLRLNRNASACTLLATATPTAAAATSAAFDVTPRDCTPVAYSLGVENAAGRSFGDTIVAFIEADDCAVARPGGSHPTHAFSITIPPGITRSVALRYVPSAATRVESAIWGPATAFQADSALPDSAGTVTYVLGAGVHQFRAMTAAPGSGASYVITSEAQTFSAGPLGCRVLAARGTTHRSAFGLGGTEGCVYQFMSRTGANAGRRYVTFLPAGQEATVVLSLTPGSGSEVQQPYLEVVDVTSDRVLLGSRDHTTDGTFTVAASGGDRWIEFIASRSNDLAIFWTLTIN